MYDIPSAHSRDKGEAVFVHALATCHSLKIIGGEFIGDPLDVKMFGFTRWTLEEGQVGGTVVKAKSGAERPAALVQIVVRPPGSAQFRLEDALKGASKVRLGRYVSEGRETDIWVACPFFGIGCYSDV